MKLIDSNISQLMQNAMDTYSLRHRITSANIANIDTPAYKKHEVQFEQELLRVQESRGQKAMIDVNPIIVENDEKVILEDELIEMADTQIRVNVVARSLRHHFEMLRTGITGINR